MRNVRSQAALDLVYSALAGSHAVHNPAANSSLAQISNGLKSLCTELRSIQALIPSHAHMGVSVKAKWALRKKEFNSRMRDVESRKTALLIALEFLSMQTQETLLRKTHDVESAMLALQNRVDDTNTTIHMVRQSVSSRNAELSASTDVHTRTLHDIMDRILCEGDKIRDAAYEQGHGLRRLEDMLSIHGTKVEQSVSVHTQLLQDLSESLPEERSKLNSCIDKLIRIASSTSSPSRTTSTNYNIAQRTEHIIACIAREEIRRVMAPIVENFGQVQSRNGSLIEALERITQDLSVRLWNDASLNPEDQFSQMDRTANTEYSSTAGTAIPREFDPIRHLGHESQLDITSDVSTDEPHTTHPQRPTKRREKLWVYWSPISWLGTIRIEITSSKRRNKTARRWTTYISVSTTFWPSWPLLRNRCVALLYDTEPFHNGYHQLFPMITTFPIISNDAPVWELIESHDLDGLRHALENNLASPNDQDEHGITLLHVAAARFNLEACKLLLESGAHANRPTACGETPLTWMLESSWHEMVWHLEDCHYPLTYELLFQIFQALLLAGGDVEECELRLEESGVARPPDPDLSLLADFSSMLRRAGKNIVEEIGRFHAIFCFTNSFTMGILLACGMSPNYDRDPWNSPIFVALYNIVVSCYEMDTEECEALMNDLCLLLDAGADIYTTAWVDSIVFALSGRFSNSPITTPTMFAIDRDIERFWMAALRRAGYDPLEVYAEDERRRRQFIRCHGATTTELKLEGPEEQQSSLRLRGNAWSNNDDDRMTG